MSEVGDMRDYVRGAYEALCWVRVLIKDEQRLPPNHPEIRMPDESEIRLPPGHPPILGRLDGLLRKVEEALEDINEGVAVDFRQRLRAR